MKRPPNIIFILMDDMGWRDLSCYGSTFYETPNLDRLAGQGMRFTDAYAACPVCSPTRASILTGRYPATVGVTDYIHWTGNPCRGKLIDAPYLTELPLCENTIARALKAGGYQTWHVGKWHLGGPDYYPERHGFDVNIAGCDWGMPENGYFSPYGIPTMVDGPPGEYLTDRLTDEAIHLMRSAKEAPYFLNLAHYAVHNPIEAREEWTARYIEKAAAMGLDRVETFKEGEYFPTDSMRHERICRRLVQSNPAYAAMIQNLDENVGRLLSALDETGQADNTMVIFTSDNGGLATAEGSPTSNLPLAEGKGWMYEGGTREPLIVRWPGTIQPGSLCSVPITSPDFYPTLLEAAGLEPLPRQHLDGVSLVPLLRGKQDFVRGPLFWHYPHYANQGGTPGCSIRDGDYKLIEFFEDGRLELYNLRLDIGETHNLSETEPEITAQLHKRLIEWRESVEAKLPERNPDYVARG